METILLKSALPKLRDRSTKCQSRGIFAWRNETCRWLLIRKSTVSLGFFLTGKIGSTQAVLESRRWKVMG